MVVSCFRFYSFFLSFFFFVVVVRSHSRKTFEDKANLKLNFSYRDSTQTRKHTKDSKAKTEKRLVTVFKHRYGHRQSSSSMSSLSLSSLSSKIFIHYCHHLPFIMHHRHRHRHCCFFFSFASSTFSTLAARCDSAHLLHASSIIVLNFSSFSG